MTAPDVKRLAACILQTSWLLSIYTAAAVVDRAPSPSAGLSVRIHVNVSQHLVRLSCEVAGAPGGQVDAHEVQFFCPVGGGSKCFGDCNPICTMLGDSSCRAIHQELLSPHVACAKAVVRPDAKTVELMIDTRVPRLAGGWYCRFRGQSSAEVSLNLFKPTTAVATTTTTTPTTATTSTKAPPTTTVPKSAAGPQAASGLRGGGAEITTVSAWPGDQWTEHFQPEPEAPGHMQQPKGHGVDPNMLQFARADYVIGILTLLGVSLAINVAFCIRCFLAHYYVAVRRRKQEPPGCLAQCLCVSTVKVEERAPDDTYEELRGMGRSAVGSYAAASRLPQRASLGTMETTYMEHSGCIPRSRTLPPVNSQQYSLSYLQGVSDSMSRLLYDSVPPQESRPASRQGSMRGFGGSGSLRRSQQFSGVIGGVGGSGGGVPAVPEESMPFVTDSGEAATLPELEEPPTVASVAATSAGGDEAEVASSSGSPGTSRLELSRRMLRKADTLLREANSLLRETAQPPHQQQQQRRQSLTNSITAIATTHQQQQ